MFTKIEISHFKAFEHLFSITFNKKNFIAYGDNGSGKSSLYEALVLALDYMHVRHKATEGINEGDERFNTELISYLNEKYLCRHGEGDFSVKIDDVSYDSYDSSNKDVFCICSNILHSSSTINLLNLLSSASLHCRAYIDIDSFLQAQSAELISNTNIVLKNILFEDIQVEKREDYSLTLKEHKRGLSKDQSFNNFFNESKIHMVKLVLLIESWKLMMTEDNECYLLLDDIVSSFDASNRTCILHYLMDDKKLSRVHRIIFTHNMNFFNLVRFTIQDTHHDNDWQIGRIYELNLEHRYFDWGVPESDFDAILTDILDETQEKGDEQIKSLGNKLRQLLERYINDYCFLISTVLKQNVGDIITNLLKKNPQKGEFEFYKIENGEILPQSLVVVREIKAVVHSLRRDTSKEKRDLVQAIDSIFDKYKGDDNWESLKKSLFDIQLLLKTSLHPLSHDHESAMTIKELRITAQCLKKLKENVLRIPEGASAPVKGSLYLDKIDLNA